MTSLRTLEYILDVAERDRTMVPVDPRTMRLVTMIIEEAARLSTQFDPWEPYSAFGTDDFDKLRELLEVLGTV